MKRTTGTRSDCGGASVRIPPTYIPSGTPKGLSLTEASGTWFVDAADGWRFFVPKGGVPDCPEGVLLGEARKITNTRTPGQNTRRNFGRWFFGILMLPALGLEHFK